MAGSHFPHPTCSHAGLAGTRIRQKIKWHFHSQSMTQFRIPDTYESWGAPTLHPPPRPCKEKQFHTARPLPSTIRIIHIPVFRSCGIRIWNVFRTVIQPVLRLDSIGIWDFGRGVLVPVIGLCGIWVRDPNGR